MDIPLDTVVRCGGEECGTSQALVLDPIKEEVSYVVVKQKDAPHSQRLVPVSCISSSSADGIDLSCSANDMRAMDRFVETELLKITVPRYVETGIYYSMPYVERDTQSYSVPVKEEHVPVGEVAVRRGAYVEATDGHVGRVDEFVVDRETDSITGLVMREGHLWAKKDVVIPIADVDKYEENTVYLKTSKEEISNLPEVSIDRKELGQ